MGRITALFAWKVLTAAEGEHDRAALLRSIGLDPAAAVDAAAMIPSEAYYDLFERLARAEPHGERLPLRAGASMRCDDYGAFGLAWKAAPSLRDSYERAERYARLLTSVSTYELREAGEAALMLLHRAGERRLGLRLSNEATIAAIAAISAEVSTRAFQPLEIRFKHAAPASIAAHERHFGCPVRFEAEEDGLLAPKDALARPNRLGDPGLAKFFDAHLEGELAALADEDSLGQRVRIQISQALSAGVPNLSDIGARLGMSGRSLQRRLAEQGLTIQRLIDEARRELAERLLAESDYSIAEIAFLTGFSDQSALTRAFKRWSGGTPRAFRLAAQARR